MCVYIYIYIYIYISYSVNVDIVYRIVVDEVSDGSERSVRVARQQHHRLCVQPRHQLQGGGGVFL